MTGWIAAVALMALAILLDLVTGNFGLAPGFAVYASIYLGTASRFEYGVAAALIAGGVETSIYGGGGLMALLTPGVAVLAALAVCRRMQRDKYTAMALPGAVAGLLLSLGFQLSSDQINWWQPGFGALWGAFVLPAAARIIDALGGAAGYPQLLCEPSPRLSSRGRKRRLGPPAGKRG